jgi:hypothetical protein
MVVLSAVPMKRQSPEHIKDLIDEAYEHSCSTRNGSLYETVLAAGEREGSGSDGRE